MNGLVRQIIPHAIAAIALLLVSVIYFYPQLEGKKIRQGDVINYLGMSQEIKEYEKKDGEKVLWTNRMFGGMPTFQINTMKAGNQLTIADSIFRLGLSSEQPIGRFFGAMIGFYILLVVLGVNPWLSIGGAIAFGLSTNNLILFEAGHMSKVKTIFYFPLMIAGMLLAFRQKYLMGGALFALGLGLNLLANHIQMTYYLLLTLLIFGVAQLIHHIQQKTVPDFLKSAGTLILAGLLAIGCSTSNLWVTYEYSKTTMRGKPILAKTENRAPTPVSSSSETDGLAWDYAMQWSNGVIDLFGSFIPGAAGGGSYEKISNRSPLMKDPNWRALMQQNQYLAPSYWGALPFTSGPSYFGAAMLLLFIMGLTLVKGPVKWWLALGTLLTFGLSMGKNMEWLNHFLFDYLPLFNKFRAPNSVLSVTAFLFPLLGFLALHEVITGKASKEDVRKSLMIAGGVCGAIFLFFALLGPGSFDFSAPGDARYQAAGLGLQPLIEARQSLMTGDAWRALLLAGAAAGLIWFFNAGQLKKGQLIAGIVAITLFDLWGVGTRYLDHEDFFPINQVSTIDPTPADEQIRQDKDPHFRVFDASDPNIFQSSRLSYFHNSLGGNHAAKLQRYQDIIDYHLSQGNLQVMNMLNTKYLITPGQNGQQVVKRNPGALGNAWFVDTISIVNTPNQEIESLNGFNPAREAIVHQEFKDDLPNIIPDSNNTIQLIDYHPNRMTYQANAQKDGLAVFSEVWYTRNNDWQAYIDDQPVDHIRANYILRALKIPAGEHTIRFEFDPPSYKTGKTISLISSGLLLLLVIGSLGYYGYQFVQTHKNVPPAKPTIKVKGPKPGKGKSGASAKKVKKASSKGKKS